ncbi:uncharacterized protein PSFLO_00746 [Pseudozyma flocculosa]|uniref:Uncharacterized protein n=1 Tax=Pseudozyma flocculosa TaxID=84751 RepID=A0A5C3EUB7_9BASI|nr:uncharacterized protein PSFLO_00746 [Pseudozyma flocculosa]
MTSKQAAMPSRNLPIDWPTGQPRRTFDPRDFSHTDRLTDRPRLSAKPSQARAKQGRAGHRKCPQARPGSEPLLRCGATLNTRRLPGLASPCRALLALARSIRGGTPTGLWNDDVRTASHPFARLLLVPPEMPRLACLRSPAPHRTAPHRTAPHRTARCATACLPASTRTHDQRRSFAGITSACPREAGRQEREPTKDAGRRVASS